MIVVLHVIWINIKDNKLFINDTLENLIIYDIPNNKIFQYY